MKEAKEGLADDSVNNSMDVLPQKPITVIQQDFIMTLANLINTSTLPPFIMEPVLKNMYEEVHEAAKRQYINDKNKYEQELAAAQSMISENNMQ